MRDSKTMNILMLDRYLTIGGVATYLETLCRGLMKRGHTVYIMTTADSGNRKIIDEFSSLGIQFLTIPNSKNRVITFYRFAKMLYQFLKKKDIDIMHSHHRVVNFTGMVIGKMVNVPHLITLHVFKSDHKILTKFLGNEIITVPSKALKNHLINYYGLKEERIQVIYNAIDHDYEVNEQKKASLQKNIFDDPGKFYVAFIGRITHEKGVDILLESIPLVKEKNPNVEFRIFGDGSELSKLKERCRELGLNSEEIFQGINHHVNELLCLMDLCVIPSRSESFCLLALECMRAKKPVIATNTGGIPEVVKHEETGLLVDTESPKLLSQNILKLLNNRDLMQRFAINGNQRFKEKFPLERFYEDYLAAYQQLIKMS